MLVSTEKYGPILHNNHLWPKIAELIEQGCIFWDRNSFVGIASDGVQVNLGHCPNQLSDFLKSRPTPNFW